MRVGEKLYFSPNFRFSALANVIDSDDKVKLIGAFRDRVFGYYLNPAEEADQKKYGFACGVLCVTAIDFIARFVTGKMQKNETHDRIKIWLEGNINEFTNPNPQNPTSTLADRFYFDFRCGLVHEGRVCNLGQFDYNQSELVSVKQDVMLINPTLLLAGIRRSLEDYLRSIRRDSREFADFKKNLLNDFGEEIRRARVIS